MRRSAALAAAVALATVGAAVANAYFTTDKTSTQTIQAVPDFLPPTISTSAIYTFGFPGLIPGLAFNVYAQVDDQGNPPAGVKSVIANVSALGGPSELTLNPGSYPPGHSTYNYGSSTHTAGASLLVGSSQQYSITATDNVNQAATANFNIAVSAACDSDGLSATNGGARSSFVDSGDVILYTFTTPVDQGSIVPGWTGNGSTPVLVKLANNGTSDDTLTIIKNETPLSLGTIDMNGNYASSGISIVNGTLSKSGNSIRVTVDTGPFNSVSAGQTAMTWTPGSGITYNNGIPCSAGSYTQGSARTNF